MVKADTDRLMGETLGRGMPAEALPTRSQLRFSGAIVAGLWDVLRVLPRCCGGVTALPAAGRNAMCALPHRKPAMLLRLAALLVVLFTGPAFAQDQATLDKAFDAAIALFETARPALGETELGVDVAAYRDALTLQLFSSRHWGGSVTVDLVIRDAAEGSCSRFAAFARIPPENGAVRLVFCPQFFANGADDLRRLTVLHEIVHVVAGGDECRAMAFAAQVEQAASGRFTPVDAYWSASGCEGSAFRLP